jgi:aryl-alcohol dehydrogenase-like predicted oxidoreductase
MPHDSNIGLGLAAIGRPQYINIGRRKAASFNYERFFAKGLNFIDEAYRSGIRYFDTAPGYGIAEKMMLKWLQKNNHEDIEVASKWGYTYTANFDPNASIHEKKEHSLKKLEEQWQQTKQMLPFLKTYQIHSATFESGVLENKEVLNRLWEIKEQYGIRIGLTTSGDNQSDVLEKARHIRIKNDSLFSVFQVTFNVFDQSTLRICKDLIRENHTVIVKEALANGKVFPNKAYPQHSTLYTLLLKLSEKYRVGLDAIALRFCLQALNPYIVLSGATTNSQLEENLKAKEFELEKKDFDELCSMGISPNIYWAERKQLSWN